MNTLKDCISFFLFLGHSNPELHSNTYCFLGSITLFLYILYKSHQLVSELLIPGANTNWRRMDLPLFSGDDACGWVNKVEWYFQVRGYHEKGENCSSHGESSSALVSVVGAVHSKS